MAADLFMICSGCGLGAGRCIVASKGATMVTSLPVFVSDVILRLWNVIPQRDGASNSMNILFDFSTHERKHDAGRLNVHLENAWIYEAFQV